MSPAKNTMYILEIQLENLYKKTLMHPKTHQERTRNASIAHPMQPDRMNPTIR
jgi:hypothetical protein